MTSQRSSSISSAAPDTPAVFSRQLAIAILMSVACLFASNHVAARIAFDADTGLLLAVLARSGVAIVVLSAIVVWRRETLAVPSGQRRWQLLVGFLITLQSLCLYSAVARVPVAVALLLMNTFPIQLALLTWALGGARPSLRASLIMGGILIGLVLVLDIPTWLSRPEAMGPQWLPGILFGVGAASAFSCALWVTDRKLKGLDGAVRTLLTMITVFICMVLAGMSGILPGGLATPSRIEGWYGLILLAVLYGVGFSVLFTCVPRLDMPRNAPVMNIEPVAALLLGYLVLGQVLTPIQLMGGAVVLAGIVVLSVSKGR